MKDWPQRYSLAETLNYQGLIVQDQNVHGHEALNMTYKACGILNVWKRNFNLATGAAMALAIDSG